MSANILHGEEFKKDSEQDQETSIDHERELVQSPQKPKVPEEEQTDSDPQESSGLAYFNKLNSIVGLDLNPSSTEKRGAAQPEIKNSVSLYDSTRVLNQFMILLEKNSALELKNSSQEQEISALKAKNFSLEQENSTLQPILVLSKQELSGISTSEDSMSSNESQNNILQLLNDRRLGVGNTEALFSKKNVEFQELAKELITWKESFKKKEKELKKRDDYILMLETR